MNTIETLAEFGLTPETYETLLKDCGDKVDKVSELDWSEISEKYSLGWNGDTLRKAQQPPLLGGAFVAAYFKEKYARGNNFDDDAYIKELKLKKEEIAGEVAKLQSMNMENQRIVRQRARFENFNQYVAKAIETLEKPELYNLHQEESESEYLLTISDIHYGADYCSENNVYNTHEAEYRMNILLQKTITYVHKNKIQKLNVASLGDAVQGILRISDLKLNESSVVKAVVGVSQLLAEFLNKLSAHCLIEYYHVPTSNHTQLRPLGTKASELATEDVEYIIGHYINDVLSNNNRINVHLNDNKDYIEIPIYHYNIIAMHGHTLKNLDTAIRDLNMLHHKFYDYAVVGHYHNGKLIPSGEYRFNDAECLVSPSFVGSDPYSDSLMKGSKAACNIYEFDKTDGRVGTYKMILN